MRIIAPLLFCALIACDGAEPSEPEPAPRRAHEGRIGEHSDERAPDPPSARLRGVRGAVTVGGNAVRDGDIAEAERVIEVPDDGRCALELRDGGRVELEPGSRGILIDEGAAQLLLVRGGARALQPATGNSVRPPLRVVTPTATAEIGQSGELYVHLFPGGASWITVLAGAAQVSNGEADGRRRLRTVDVPAGQAVAVPNRIAELTPGPRHLDAARAMALALAVPETEPELDRWTREIPNETQRLDQALRWLETETRRGRELTMQHRTAVREGRTDDSQRIQNELVRHSQELYRLRQLATARWERLRAQVARVAAISHPLVDDPVAQRRERVVGVLGL